MRVTSIFCESGMMDEVPFLQMPYLPNYSFLIISMVFVVIAVRAIINTSYTIKNNMQIKMFYCKLVMLSVQQDDIKTI